MLLYYSIKMLETYNRADKTLHLRANLASREYLSKLKTMRDNQLFTDIKLKTSDDQKNLKIHAHKIILACSSPYFEAMFCGAFMENREELDTGLVHVILRKYPELWIFYRILLAWSGS